MKANKRIIINIYGDTDELTALNMVKEVVAMGRISEEKGRKMFSAVTSFKQPKNGYCGAEKPSDTTDTFRVWSEGKIDVGFI